nr:hypothetical protein [Desulfobacterales bacterium]
MISEGITIFIYGFGAVFVTLTVLMFSIEIVGHLINLFERQKKK